MASFECYADMKPSNEPWMGDIPKDWGLRRLKYIFNVKKVIAGESGHTVLSVTQNGIRPKNMTDKGQFAQDYSKYQLVSTGDFVMNHMDLLTGWVDISKYDGVTSPDYRVFVNVNKDIYVSEYYRYIFQLCYSARVFYGLGQGVAGFGRWRLPAEMFLNFILPVPSTNTQNAIANYLDAKCNYIDEIIEETQKSIEDYRAWKVSIITDAVTGKHSSEENKKASGVPWIGEIPYSWQIKKIKYLSNGDENSFIDGDWIESPYITDEGIRYLTTGNIGDGKYKRQGNGYISKETFKKLNCKYAYPGDLVISRLNAPYGRSCILPDDHTEYVLAVDNVILRTDENKRYICYVTQCPHYQAAVLDKAAGTTMKRISRTNLGNIYLPIPSREEQDRIASYLDEKCGAIDALIEEKEKLLQDMELYKKSLIFEVVTGKRKVV